ncbi:MAG TPA: DUF370 domain-containing protein [Clostridia bacterium]|nr:DUF370 domain-containing protein [Clostridiaceae bacterium]HOA30494.1 DUF370 domain-containing protein [Clostridia bacterium]HPZ51378.1 DUF370 domain-containing protein [Clostridia bacterium]
MFIHIGDNIIIPVDEIVGIFDLEGTTITGITRDFLKVAEEEGFVIATSSRMPKSFVITVRNNQNLIYLSSLSVNTLKKRVKKWLDMLNNKTVRLVRGS